MPPPTPAKRANSFMGLLYEVIRGIVCTFHDVTQRDCINTIHVRQFLIMDLGIFEVIMCDPNIPVRTIFFNSYPNN
jgi:hypothetical protein